MIRAVDFVILVCAVMVGLFPLYIQLYLPGQINIEYEYLDEWNEAKEDIKGLEVQLEECKQSKIPACSPVKCSPGATGIMLGVIGFLFYVGAFIHTVIFEKRKARQEKKKKPKKK